MTGRSSTADLAGAHRARSGRPGRATSSAPSPPPMTGGKNGWSTAAWGGRGRACSPSTTARSACSGSGRPPTGCIVKAPLGKKGAAAGRGDRGEPDRPRQMRREAPPADRGAGHPPRHGALRGQPPRRGEAGRPARRGAPPAAPFGSGPSGTSAWTGATTAIGAARKPPRGRLYLAHPRQDQRRRRVPPPGHAGRHPARRWVVEAAHSWFNRFRRLLVRWEKKAANSLGFVQLAAILIIYRKLRHARTPSG